MIAPLAKFMDYSILNKNVAIFSSVYGERDRLGRTGRRLADQTFDGHVFI